MASQADRPTPEQWATKIGVILAVAGSAVGLGNFLRFPGTAAASGAGAFMIPYFLSLLLLGIPICWVEWALGRRGGRFGLNSSPGIFSVLWKHPLSKYLGTLGLLIPVVIYMYYVYIESWCLAYAVGYASGAFEPFGTNPYAYQQHFARMTGSETNGLVFDDNGKVQAILFFFLGTFATNFLVIYRGLTRGIETFCKVAMPLLILAAIVVAVRVLTLPAQPIPEPWQRSLEAAIPAPEWERFRNDLDSATLEPDERGRSPVQRLVEDEFRRYFDALNRHEPGYDADVRMARPTGFLDSPDGYRVAVAELQSGGAGRAYREWIQFGQDDLDDDVKRELQKLERRQLKNDKQLAQARGEDLRADALASRDSLETRRRELLAGVPGGPMPLLTAELIRLGVALDRALEVQQRSAAIELSELQRTVFNGLGYMWNPDFEVLANSDVWLKAAGQVFFSLSVGFGIILNYASYLRRKDDVVLSGLTASATNEFCEVSLGGLVAIPATFVFLGTATTLSVLDTQSTFGLGFNTLPTVFANMPAGRWFAVAWFSLLFLAGITSSVSMLQPAIAFLEEGFGLRRRASVVGLGLITLLGAIPVVYFSKNSVVLATLDFWVGSFALFILATIEVLIFGWVLGIEEGFDEAHRGAQIRIPWIYRPIVKYVTPAFLLTVFVAWSWQNAPEEIAKVRSDRVVLATVAGIGIFFGFLLLLTRLASGEWKRKGLGDREVGP